jgi:hypothetical protein
VCNKLLVALLVAVVSAAVVTAPAGLVWRQRAHCPCRRDETRWRIKTLRSALSAYRVEVDDSCPPSLPELVEHRFLPAPLDAWEQPLSFVCPGTHDPDGDVSSAGPDQLFGTADDINSWEL